MAHNNDVLTQEIAGKDLVINFRPDGTVMALHMDKFSLSFLGDMELGRASTIEHDEVDQSFFVLPTGQQHPIEAATQFAGYDHARSFEIDWLQECMLEGCTPHSESGRSIALAIREVKSGIYYRDGKRQREYAMVSAAAIKNTRNANKL